MKLLITIFLLASTTQAVASDPLEEALNHQYKKQTYTLRQSYVSEVQEYDSLGNTPQQGGLGPWTLYGRIEISKIKVKPDRLVVEGRRIGMKFDDHKKALVPAKLDDKVTIEVALSQPLNSPADAPDLDAEAAETAAPAAAVAEKIVYRYLAHRRRLPDRRAGSRAILSHIFAVSQEDFLASMSDLWRQYLADHLDSYADDGKQIVFRKTVRTKWPPDPPSPGTYHVGKDVTAPKPIYSPDPSYTDTAREKKLSGTLVLDLIVDESGMVRNIRLVRPLGLGLDEASAAIVNPAKRNGEPVAVEVNVEVSFNLY